MNKQWLWLGGAALLLIVAAAIGFYLASPLGLDRRAANLPPTTSAASESDASLTEEAQQPTSETTVTTTPMEEPQATASPTATIVQTVEPETPTGVGPVAFATANFVAINNAYQGSGTAAIYQQADGSRLLSFEDFMVSSGPQLHVLLATNSTPTSRDELGDYLDLGPLKDTSGDQEYQLPADLDLETYRSVVIYCVPFHVVFTFASFSP